MLFNPAAQSINSATRFRVKTWRGLRVSDGMLNAGDEFPRSSHDDQQLVAMMAMGQIEPIEEDEDPEDEDEREEEEDMYAHAAKPVEPPRKKRGRGRPKKSR